MKILAFTKYSYEGPSSRYRFYNYRNCFEKNKIEIDILPLFKAKYFKAKKIKKIFLVLKYYLERLFYISNILKKNRYNLILIEYELLPYFPAWFEYLLHKRGINYIVDYDDAIFHKYDMSTNKIIYKLFKNKIAKVINYAKHVIVCNAYLYEYAKKYNSNISSLPTVVLLEKYKKELLAFQKENNTFIVGWIGSRTTSIYILEILPAIKKFVDQYPNVQFDLVGFDKTLLSKEDLQKHHLNIIIWSEEDEIRNILAFDVGIMPLHNDPWSKGKCGFKLLQYMSCKKPVIASPVGINCSLVKNEENGFLVENIDEWFDAFEKLYLDKNLRESMAKNNFDKIVNEFNHQKNCSFYVELIKGLSV